MRSRYVTTLIVVLLALVVGCSSREDQRAAIEHALQYDETMAKTRVEESGFWGVLLGDEKARRQYVVRLRKIPLSGCPGDFVAAYKAHIAAWEANNEAEIKRTWDRVIYVASDYGVPQP